MSVSGRLMVLETEGCTLNKNGRELESGCDALRLRIWHWHHRTSLARSLDGGR